MKIAAITDEQIRALREAKLINAETYRGALLVPSHLIAAAVNYGAELRRQHELSTALDRALSRGEDGGELKREHSAACDALNAAEHALLVRAAIVGGWSREDAETSV